MRIPETKIEEIRSAANIVDIISSVIPLRKRGRNFIGLCPFHNEKTPSFTVSEEKQIFHCFGCHAGGNVFKFLMDYKKISYVEAIQELAEDLSIPIEYDEKYVEVQSEQETYYEINTMAARYFSENLLKSPEAENARKYFENRKLKLKTIRTFGLGYSFTKRDSFVKYAIENKIDMEKCLHLGLIGKYNDGNSFDRFNSRLIFPIFSPNGRVVAFAGRIMEKNENVGKYVNSPESAIYHKGSVLYGLSFAKDEIRKLDRAILVEGYMDLISLYQSGIRNVVAVSGTALTDDQIQLLSRYTKNVYVLFDADNAGVKASMRSIELLLKKDMEIRVITLPAGEDPDSYVNNYGREKFEEEIQKAKNFLEYQTAYYEKQGMLNDPVKLTDVIKELVRTLSLVRDELKRTLLLKDIAQKFNIRENLLEAELDKIAAAKPRQPENKPIVKPQLSEKKEAVTNKPDRIAEKLRIVEKDIIKLLFEGDKLALNFLSQHIHSEDVESETDQAIIETVYEEYFADNDISPAALLEKFTEEETRNYICEITFEKYSTSKRWAERNIVENEKANLHKEAEDIVKRFLSLKIDEQIKENHRRLVEAESELQSIEYMKHISELYQYKKEISEIMFITG